MFLRFQKQPHLNRLFSCKIEPDFLMPSRISPTRLLRPSQIPFLLQCQRFARSLPGRKRSNGIIQSSMNEKSSNHEETQSGTSSLSRHQHRPRKLSPEIQHELESLLFGQDKESKKVQVSSQKLQENTISKQIVTQKLEKERIAFQSAAKRAEAKLKQLEIAKKYEEEQFLAETVTKTDQIISNNNISNKINPGDDTSHDVSSTWDDAHTFDDTHTKPPSIDQEYKSLKQRNVSEPEASSDEWYIDVSSNLDSSLGKNTSSQFVPRWLKAQERAKRRMQLQDESFTSETQDENFKDESRYIYYKEIVSVLRKERAQNITVLDVRGKSDTHDYIVIMEGRSERQLYHLMQSIRIKAKHRVPAHLNMPQNVSMEGKNRNARDWFTLDLGSTIVHGFTNESRTRYNLDEIWLYHENPQLCLNLEEFSPDLILRYLENDK